MIKCLLYKDVLVSVVVCVLKAKALQNTYINKIKRLRESVFNRQIVGSKTVLSVFAPP